MTTPVTTTKGDLDINFLEVRDIASVESNITIALTPGSGAFQ